MSFGTRCWRPGVRRAEKSAAPNATRVYLNWALSQAGRSMGVASAVWANVATARRNGQPRLAQAPTTRTWASTRHQHGQRRRDTAERW